jgi:hypothetical protein
MCRCQADGLDPLVAQRPVIVGRVDERFGDNRLVAYLLRWPPLKAPHAAIGRPESAVETAAQTLPYCRYLTQRTST